MAASDAIPVPRKNTAWRMYFAIRKNDGTLITSWAGADTEISKDGAAFADCTNEATEIGTSGCGYIDLTSTEMNADCVMIKTTVTNTDALPVVTTVHCEEAGDYRLAATPPTAGEVADAVWDEATSGHTTSGTFGEQLKTDVDAILADTNELQTNQGNWLTATGFSTHSAADAADAVWEELIADHSGTSGSTAEALAAAGSAGDPWSTALPGAYSAGTAGYIVGTNLNATVSSRATQTSVDTIDGIVDSILVDTAEIGAAGAGLTEAGGTGDQFTAIPWNASWDAEVQSEVADALAVYDPPTNAELEARTIVAANYALESTLTEIKGGTFNGGTDSLEVIRDALSVIGGDVITNGDVLALMAGAGFDTSTDSLEAIRNRGDSAWTTATGFSTHSAADVWSVATRVLTDGTNIVLAKGVGVTGFNDLSAAQVNAEVDTALADYDGPTNAEMIARTPSATAIANVELVFNTDFATNYTTDNNGWVTYPGGYYDQGQASNQAFPNNFASLGINASGHVSRVTLTDTVTTYTGNTPQTGDAYAIVNSGTHGNAALKTLIDTVDTVVDSILADVGTDGVVLSSATQQSIATALLDLSNGVETSYTLRQALRLILSSAAAKLSGAATTTVTIRDIADTKDRITATVDASGNRTAVSVDAS